MEKIEHSCVMNHTRHIYMVWAMGIHETNIFLGTRIPTTEWRYQNFDRNRYRDFFPLPNFPIHNFPKSRLLFREQIFWNRNRYFFPRPNCPKRILFSQTKFSETDTFFWDQNFQNQDFYSETKFSETLQKMAKASRPRSKLLNILDNFWKDCLQILPSFFSLIFFSLKKKDILLLRIVSSFFFSFGIERHRQSQRSSLCFPPSNS